MATDNIFNDNNLASSMQFAAIFSDYKPEANHSANALLSPDSLSILTAALLGCVVLGTVIGNTVVIVAIAMDRRLQRPQNLLIISLACSDLAIGFGVLPLSAYYEGSGRQWVLGNVWCKMWNFLDVAACTASILNLVVIALDRYLSITDVQYSQQRNNRKVLAMIAIVWILSVGISLLPSAGWRHGSYYARTDNNNNCQLSEDIGFQIVSAVASFYLPLIAIITLYAAIYRAAKHRIRRKTSAGSSTCSREGSGRSKTRTPSPTNAAASSGMLSAELNKKITRLASVQSNPADEPSPSVMPSLTAEHVRRLAAMNPNSTIMQIARAASLGTIMCNDKMPKDLLTRKYSYPVMPNQKIAYLKTLDVSKRITPKLNRYRKRMSVELMRERKAFNTLAVVTGTFLVLWLPYFISSFLRLALNVTIDETTDALLVWMGWANSLINPVIYTVFSPDFRIAFKSLMVRHLPCFEDQLSRSSTASGPLAHSTGLMLSVTTPRILPKFLVVEATTGSCSGSAATASM